MEGLRYELALTAINESTTIGIGDGQRIADALLALDGLLFPALRALGREATDTAQVILDALVGGEKATGRDVLRTWGITGPLADACLAAAEALK